MPESTAADRELAQLEADLKRLEAEYNMFFAGRLARPPWETRSRIDAVMKRYDRAHIQAYGDRFRFATLQSRFQTFVELWDRGLRAREEGRPGPFGRRAPDESSGSEHPADYVLHVAAFTDPVREADKLRELYDRLADARRETGEPALPFHRFADLIRDRVRQLREQSGSPEVAIRVAMKDGKVNVTARTLRGARAS